MDRAALRSLSYGIYILTTEVENIPYGCVINTAFQITSKPPCIAISCNKDNFTHSKIQDSKKFGISVLSEASSQDIIGTFGYKSGRDIDKFFNLDYTFGDSLNLPIFPNESVATFECKVVNTIEVGTHTIFIGEVVDCITEDSNEMEMTYRYFHDERKGLAPKNAPTFIEESGPTEKNESWECTICKYVYSDDVPFKDLPETWVCPICGATKEHFIKL